MSEDTAARVLDAIATGALVLWMIGLRFAVRTRARLRQPSTVEVEVPGDGGEAAARFAAVLAGTPRSNPLGGSVITSAGPSGLRWSSTGPLRHDGELQIASRSPGRLVATVTSRSPLPGVALLAVLFGLSLIVALYLLLGRFVVSASEPAVRAQVMQMVQCVHALWPPFLLGGLARRQRTLVVQEVERTLRNTPFLANPPTAST